MMKFLRPAKLTAAFAVLLAGALALAGCPGNNGGGGGPALLPPETPEITAVEPDSGTLTVRWAAAARAVSYDLAWAPVPADPDEEVDEGDKTIIPTITGLYYTITGLTNFDYYYVWVRAVNTAGISAWSYSERMAPTPSPAAIPANVQASATGISGEIELTWDASANAVEYEVRFRYLPAGDWVEHTPTPPDAITMLFTGLVDGVTYEFQVRAVNDYDVWTTWSAVVTAVPMLFAEPGAVQVLTVSSVIGADNSLLVEWEAPYGYLVQGYRIRFSATSVDPLVGYTYFGGLHTGTSVTVTGLARETLYAVWVQAVAGPYYSDWSARGTGATYPFTQAFDIIVVGAGAAGGSAVFAARAGGAEQANDFDPIVGAWGVPSEAPMQNPDIWNDLSVLLVEKRHIWGGMTNTAGPGNAQPGNQAQWHAVQRTDFNHFRTLFTVYLRSPVAMGAGNHGDAGIAGDENHFQHIPLPANYPNWSKSWAAFRQMQSINSLLHRRGRHGLGTAATTSAMFNRIGNNGLAEIRLNTQATELITTGPATNATSVIGVVTREMMGNPTGTAVQNTILGTPTGREERIAARRVIISSGGFSNLRADEVIAAGLVPAHGNVAAAHFAPTGHVNSYGTGIIMAMDIGAAITANYGAINNAMNLARHLRGIGMGAYVMPRIYPLPTDGSDPLVPPVGNWGAFFGNAAGFGATAPMWRVAQIMVNNQGLRFRAEAALSNAMIYDMTRAENWPVWAIFSSVDLGPNIQAGAGLAGPDPAGAANARPRIQVLETVWNFLQTLPEGDMRRQELVRGTTLAELAAAMGLTGAAVTAFVNEVVTYDAAVIAAGNGGTWADPLTDPAHPNHRPGWLGKAAGAGNGNLIRFLPGDAPDGTETGIFWAIRMHPAVWDSTGGLATDMWGRVLREELPLTAGGEAGFESDFNVNYIVPANPANIIRNLYAAGAAANRWFYGYQYQSMTSVGVAGLQGGLSGLHAARGILGIPHTLPIDNAGAPWPSVVFED
ncbi:MAG: fibronectin type III domain-containing protein [Treponema sp.]|nr:fibronectin type III domain-containing protein [Treponema sp.]